MKCVLRWEDVQPRLIYRPYLYRCNERSGKSYETGIRYDCRYLGMSDKLPNLCYYNNEEYSFNRPYSEKTAELIDEEVKKMVNEQYERAKKDPV